MTENPILQTKLHRPPALGNLVPRPFLIDRLNHFQQRPLTLVSAPAGYGKTTLISSWLESLDCPTGWISIDKHDDDPVTFLSYFLSAINSIKPKVVTKTLALLKSPELPPTRVLASVLTNDLILIDEPFVLVLDDFNNIRHMDILDLINGLLQYPPSGMHLVLITRSDPPLDLTKLRARGYINEIRVQELRFIEAEVKEYLHLISQEPVNSKTSRLLEEKSEGWVTGLHLLALSMNQLDDDDWTRIDRLANNRLVEDYLLSIILEAQEPAFVDCLLKTAILDRFCASLCTAVCEQTQETATLLDGETFISTLRESNLFVIPLDARQKWLRYHLLFQDLLLNQLQRRHGKALIRSLHSRASAWYAENGFIDEALRHALTAGETELAASLVAHHRHDLMNREEWRLLERWLKHFPPDSFEEFPDLLMTRAWLAYYLWYDLTETWRLLERFDGLTNDEFADDHQAIQLKAEAAAIRSQYQWWFADASAATASAQNALLNTPHAHECVRSTALIIVGGSLPMSGEFNKGQAFLMESLRDGIFQEPSSNARLLFALCFVYWIEGALNKLLEAGKWLYALSQEHGMIWSTSYACYFLGVANFERNELVQAEKHLGHLIENRYLYPMQNVGHSAFPLALLFQANGQEDKAQKVVQDASDLAFEKQNQTFAELIDPFQVELALHRGQSAAAINWAQQYQPGEFKVMHRFFIPELTYAKALIAQDTPAAHQEASKFLMQMEEHAQAIHNNSGLMRVLILQAMLASKQGDDSRATAKLQGAVQIGELGGWIRPFVDSGPEIAGLLRKLQKKGISRSYIGQILAAFPATRQQSPQVETDRSSNEELIEPLTARELVVLKLLAQQLSNKEIAAELHISLGTVGQHTHNIYQKLAVNARWPAVTKAVELGILQPNNTTQ